VITPEGCGEVMDALGDNIIVELDKGFTKTFPSGELEDDNNAR
jgi:hypothetical protein